MGKKIEKSAEGKGDVTDKMLLKESFDLSVFLHVLRMSDPGRGRLWAIAATDAEKLHAWIAYICSSEDEDEEQ